MADVSLTFGLGHAGLMVAVLLYARTRDQIADREILTFFALPLISALALLIGGTTAKALEVVPALFKPDFPAIHEAMKVIAQPTIQLVFLWLAILTFALPAIWLRRDFQRNRSRRSLRYRLREQAYRTRKNHVEVIRRFNVPLAETVEAGYRELALSELLLKLHRHLDEIRAPSV